MVYEFTVLSAVTAFIEFFRNGYGFVSLRIHYERVLNDIAFVFVHNVFFVHDVVSEKVLSACSLTFAPTFFESAIDFLCKFFRKVLIESFENRFHHTPFRAVCQIFHSRKNGYAVISQCLFVNDRFKFVS